MVKRKKTAREWDPRTLEEKEPTQPQGDKELEQVTCESDAKLDKNHEQPSGMQESIEAEGTEERVLALRTKMCERSGVTSVEEGRDVESDVAEETMSAMVKLAKAMCEPYDIGQPTAECQFRGLPGESWLHDEASRVEQKTVSSDGGRCAPQIDEIVGILKWSKDKTSTDLTALEKKGLDRKTNHQDPMKAETQPKPARPPPWRDKEEAARQEVEEERTAETEVQCCGLHPCT